MLTTDTRGLVIADRNPDFREIGFRAATLFADHLGIDCDLCLIDARDPFEATRAKLSEVLRRTQTHNVLFCDADLWLVRRPADIEVPADIDEGFVCAVADPSPRHPGGFTFHDFNEFGLAHNRAFNTGLFWAGRGSREVFEFAAGWLGDNRAHLKDWGEQTAINAAVQLTRAPFRQLPTAWNWSPIAAKNGEQPNLTNPLGVHACSYPSQDGAGNRVKLRVLEYFLERQRTPGFQGDSPA